MRFQLTTALVALLSATSTTALGINCQGSVLCGGYGKTDMMAGVIYNLQNGFCSDTQTFTNGQQIACDGNVCAFLQNTSGPRTVAQIKGYLNDIHNHGCKVCGSDPTEPGNNVATGQLTVNYVSNAAPAC